MLRLKKARSVGMDYGRVAVWWRRMRFNGMVDYYGGCVGGDWVRVVWDWLESCALVLALGEGNVNLCGAVVVVGVGVVVIVVYESCM